MAMQRATTLALLIAGHVALTGCQALEMLRSAVPDLKIPRAHTQQTCEFYRQRARGMVEYAWERDWPQLAPVFAEKRTPQEDEAMCRQMVLDAGATFATRPNDNAAASATCSRVWLASDWSKRSPVHRASTMCHEAAHILSQKREGCGYWTANYATVSGRLGYEAIGYAISDAMYERHGWSAERIAKRQAKRANEFPEKYRLERTLDVKCTGEYFRDVRDGLRKRAGV